MITSVGSAKEKWCPFEEEERSPNGFAWIAALWYCSGMKIFTAELNEYAILTLELKDYKRSGRNLPGGYRLLLSTEDLSKYRETEKKLLQYYFVVWSRPFHGRLHGMRKDSPIFVVQGDKLVAGVYLCDENELDRVRWGQLHYAFMDPSHAGMGIYSAIFREAIARAGDWGLDGLVLTSDRFMLPEVYIGWGAIPFKTFKKGLLRKAAGYIWNILQWNGR